MTVGSVKGTQFQGTASMQEDSVSKNIRNQIKEVQKQLQEVANDKNMSAEDKRKKKQELQQQIADLNQELRQHEIQQRREKNLEKRQQAEAASKEADSGAAQRTGKAKAAGKGNSLSRTEMTAMLSADSSVKQAQVQGNVATKMEGRAGVLKAEIKQDAGGDTSRKEAELAETQQKAASATAAQIGTLAKANRTLEEAARSGQDAGTSRTEKTDRDGGSQRPAEALQAVKEKEVSRTGQDGRNESAGARQDEDSNEDGAKNRENGGNGALPNYYVPVDVRI